MRVSVRKSATVNPLRPWPNGLGFSYQDWEIVPLPDGAWSAARKPAFFGGTSHVGRGATWVEAVESAGKTLEYSTYLERQREKARRRGVPAPLRAAIRISR